jgi:hypothetical protein
MHKSVGVLIIVYGVINVHVNILSCNVKLHVNNVCSNVKHRVNTACRAFTAAYIIYSVLCC